MPTHLLALCSGRLKGKIQKTKSGMEVGVWAPPSLEEVGEVDLALDVSVGWQLSIAALSDADGVYVPSMDTLLECT